MSDELATDFVTIERYSRAYESALQLVVEVKTVVVSHDSVTGHANGVHFVYKDNWYSLDDNTEILGYQYKLSCNLNDSRTDYLPPQVVYFSGLGIGSAVMKAIAWAETMRQTQRLMRMYLAGDGALTFNTRG